MGLGFGRVVSPYMVCGEKRSLFVEVLLILVFFLFSVCNLDRFLRFLGVEFLLPGNGGGVRVIIGLCRSFTMSRLMFINRRCL